MFNVKTTHNGKKSVWKLGEEFRQTWRNNCLLVKRNFSFVFREAAEHSDVSLMNDATSEIS